MKKLTFVIILISMLSFGSSFGQSLEKGNLLGIHILTVNLDPDVTMNQYKEFVLTKMIPAWEKHFEMKVYLLHAMQVHYINCLGTNQFASFLWLRPSTVKKRKIK